MNHIKKAIIPVGGFGTRFLPATKTIPKEMFPIWNKPVVLRVVEEVVAAGIEEIIFVVAQHKEAIEGFFAPNEMLEKYFQQLGKKEHVEELKKISHLAHFTFVYTEPPMGNGGALKAAEHLVKDEPFLVLWGDEFFLSNGKPRTKLVIEAFERLEKPVISAVEIEEEEKQSLYGMAELKAIRGEKEVMEILKIVEKPARGKAPSNFAVHGCYALPPTFFEYLKKTKRGRDGELWITDILNEMKKETGLFACLIPGGKYLDCGNPRDYLLSQIEYALHEHEDPKLRKELLALLQKHAE